MTAAERLASLPALACGSTPVEAAAAFVAKWPEFVFSVIDIEHATEDDPSFRVRARLSHGDGWTSIKIDGVAVPGGYVVTEWI